MRTPLLAVPLAAALAVPPLAAAGCAAVQAPPPVDCAADLAGPLGDLGGDGERGGSGAFVVSGPGVECAGGFGGAGDGTGGADGVPVTPDAVVAIGSITKTVTAAAVLGLAAEGRLDLDAPVGTWLPDLPDAVAAVTPAQLLSHSGGLGTTHGEDDSPLGRAGALAAIGDQDLLFEPGSAHGYSNSGYTVLAAVVDEVTGSYRRHVVDEILTTRDGRVLGGFWDGDLLAPGTRAPGLADDGTAVGTGGRPGEFWALEGNGGVAMSPQQLHDWLRALAAGEVVPEAAVERMTTPVRATAEGDGEEAMGFVALDDARTGRRALVTSGGGGTGHEVTAVWVPDADLVAVVATTGPGVRAGDLARPVVVAALTGEPVEVPARGVPVDPAEIAAVTGTYELADGSSLDVAGGDDALEVGATGAGALAALFPAPEGEDAGAHEALVADAVAGTTQPGRDLLDALAEDIGEVRSAEVTGTAWIDGEFRTWARVVGADRSVDGWVALDGRGQLAAADFGGDTPRQRLIRTGDGSWRPASGAAQPGSPLTFDGDRMLLSTPDGPVTATRAAGRG